MARPVVPLTVAQIDALAKAGRAAHARGASRAPWLDALYRETITGARVGDPIVAAAAEAWQAGYEQGIRVALRTAGLPA